MTEVRNWLQQFSPLSDKAWSSLEKRLVGKKLCANERFHRAGQRAGSIGFLVGGALYARYTGAKRRHSVAYFNLPSVNRVVCDLESFTSSEVSKTDIIAVEPSTLLVLSRKDLYTLYDQHQEIERLGRRLMEYSYCKVMERISRMELKQRARLEDLESRYPEVIQCFQDQLIADYLGIGKTRFSTLKRELLRAA